MEDRKKRLTRQQASKIFMENIGLVRFIASKNAPFRSILGDIINDAWLHFVERAEKWDYNPAKVPALLRAITENMAKRHWQRYSRDRDSTLQEIAYFIQRQADKSDVQEGNEEERILSLRACLQKLSEENRALIELYYFDGVGYREISERTQKTMEATYKQVSRIRALLYDCVENALKQEIPDV